MKKSDRWKICLAISLLAALVYGCVDLQTAFSQDWIVQDDARQHIFWLVRLRDSELFASDAIADYFQSVAPWGYSTLYRWGMTTGLDPFVLGKLMPIPLRVATAYFFFSWCRTIFPVSWGCMSATLLFNYSVWLKDDIVSATPRAFLLPFFLAFLYYYNKEVLIPCLVSLVCLSLFYPQMVLVAWGMLLLKLVSWRGYLPCITPDVKQHRFAVIGLTVGFMLLLPYALKTSDYAPIVTRAEALTMPEFYPGGRASFFKETVWQYLYGRGRGVLLSPSAFKPGILYISLLLPFMWLGRKHFPLLRNITPKFSSVGRMLLASVGMYAIAHLFLFRFHLPSRYTGHTIRIAVNLAAGIVLASLLHRLWLSLRNRFSISVVKTVITMTVIVIAISTHNKLITADLDSRYKISGYEVGEYPQLYRYFQQQPKNSLIASLTSEADNIPSFSQRSVLVSREYAIPYQLGYYQPFIERLRDTIAAQYTSDSETIKAFIKKYRITHWLLETDSFQPQYLEQSWLKHYPETTKAIANLQNNQVPVLQTIQDDCTALTVESLIVLDARCLSNSE